MPLRWTSPATQKPDADDGYSTGRPQPAVHRHAGTEPEWGQNGG